ncbi:MAG: succinylglutamate desuccinylase/aspartoacylase family protein [Ignavibacteria bacterium]|nr:succinylglutamate desuccinylase/aspartoacylase family protein [Ignavibacteria bacterium]
MATLKLNLSEDTLWISAQELVTSKTYKEWLDALSQFDFVDYTIAGKSSLGKPIYKMTIKENENNNYLFIIGRNHPPEVTGYFGLKNFVEAIAEESELASEFRKKITTVVIPFVNPDGVDKGHWRHNINGVDLNRDWIQFNQSEPRVVKNEVEKILSNNKSNIILFIDFHSTIKDIFYTFSRESLMKEDLSEERKEKRTYGYNFISVWLQNVQERLPDYQVNIIDSLSKSTSPTSDRWIMREFDVPGFTYEVGDKTNRELIKKVAQTAAEEFMRRSPLLISP